jgi:hypothetical protein
MNRWRVGDVEIVRVEADPYSWPLDRTVPDWAVPSFAADTSSYLGAFSAFGLTSGSRKIVVDPWLGNDFPRDQPDAADRAAELLGALADAGFPPDEVDTVVNTHIDGAGWNTRPDGAGGWRLSFPRARYLYPKAEIDAYHRDEDAVAGADLSPLVEAGVLEAVEPPFAVTDDVRIVSAPGENFGHSAVEIESGGALAMIPGHLVASVLHVIDLSPADGESAEGTDSRQRVLAQLAERRGLLLSPLMGGTGGGFVEPDGDSYKLVAAP